MKKLARILLIVAGSFLALTILIVVLSPDEKSATEAAPPKEVVYNSEWDASVAQVKDYLKAVLHDPRSVEYVEWSPVVKLPDEGYLVRCKFRAKNAFGGLVLEEKSFRMDEEGSVVSMTDYQR